MHRRRLMTVRRLFVTALAALPLAGCMMDTVRQRFAVDYGCDEHTVLVEELPGNAFRADGCRHSQVYACMLSRGTMPTCMREA